METNSLPPKRASYRLFYLLLIVLVLVVGGVFLYPILSKELSKKTIPKTTEQKQSPTGFSRQLKPMPTVDPLQITGNFENLTVSENGKTGVLTVKVVTSLPSAENKNGVITTYQIGLDNTTIMKTASSPVGKDSKDLVVTPIKWQELKKDKILSVSYHLKQKVGATTDIPAELIKEIQITLLP